MATVIIMPRQGQSVESCIITEINKKKGDKVSQGDVLFAYETDKASFEETSPADGIVLELFFNEGDEVTVLENVLVIGNPGENTDHFLPKDSIETKATALSVAIKEEKAVPVIKEELKPDAIENRGKSGISPRAKVRADKDGINISNIKGTGPNGRIIEKDIIALTGSMAKSTKFAKQVASEEDLSLPASGTGLAGSVTSKDLLITGTSSPADYTLVQLSNIRKLIAKAMHASLQNSAQLTHHLGADARKLLELRKKVKIAVDKGYQTNITLNDMVCFAVIKALKKFPNVNSHFMGDSMKIFNKVNLGIAVDTDRGLMVPVIINADDLSVQGLSNQLKGVAASCRKGNVNPELLASEAASFTISNLGNYGVEMFTPVINLPQSAILGVNAIVPRPKDLGDGVYGFVPFMGLSLTYDHRALDGGEATRFLKQIAVEIENLDFVL